MEKKKDLSYYTQLNYDIIIRHLGDSYHLFIPELSLIVESEDLGNAYDNLKKEKIRLFRDMISAKTEDFINEPRSKAIRNNLFSELPLFCIKTLIVFFVSISLLGLLFIGTLPLANSLANSIQARITASTYALATKAKTELTNLSDEEIKKLRMLYRKLIDKETPFFDDTKPEIGEKNENNTEHIEPSE